MNKWLVLALVTLVHMLAVGLPWTVMPVLFTAASGELALSLAQMGLLWSMLPMGSALVALPGGMLGDRLGFVKTIGIGCFAVAAASGLRGVSTSMAMLTVFMFLSGASVALIFPNLQRVAGAFFPRRQVGLATGISISGFAVGGALTTALSATVLLPLVGSWRNVLFLYSAVCMASGVAWLLVMRRAPERSPDSPGVSAAGSPTFRNSIVRVLGVRDVWLLSIGNLGIVGSFISLNGYLPVYLETTGIAKSVGDTMSSMLFGASILGAIAIPALADRTGALKAVMIAAAVAASVAIFLLSLGGQTPYWVLIPLAGALTQGVGTLVVAHTVQMKEIGVRYAGTALGLIGGLANVGGFIMPAIGGRLAEANATWPFYFWALASLSGAACLVLLRGDRQRRVDG